MKQSRIIATLVTHYSILTGCSTHSSNKYLSLWLVMSENYKSKDKQQAVWAAERRAKRNLWGKYELRLGSAQQLAFYSVVIDRDINLGPGPRDAEDILSTGAVQAMKTQVI